MLELELKARVVDVARVRNALRESGAIRCFAGRLRDRRFDRGGELKERDQVMRIRSERGDDGSVSVVLAWKGPTHLHEGFKARIEHEARLAPGSDASPILEGLGFEVVQVIDRYVEVWSLGEGEARIEWYPEMDELIEVEGSAEAIDRLIVATGIDRAAFSADPLPRFAAEYARRTGRPARLLLDASEELPAHWPSSPRRPTVVPQE